MPLTLRALPCGESGVAGSCWWVSLHRPSTAGGVGFCWVCGACRNEALIYTSKCGVKGMTIGISALKHTLQHSRLLSKKVL